jgi:hypothetical protein
MQAINLEQAALLGHSSACQRLGALAPRHPAWLAQAIFVVPTTEFAHHSLSPSASGTSTQNHDSYLSP